MEYSWFIHSSSCLPHVEICSHSPRIQGISVGQLDKPWLTAALPNDICISTEAFCALGQHLPGVLDETFFGT